jgi:HK97 family phage prohead protease
MGKTIKEIKDKSKKNVLEFLNIKTEINLVEEKADGEKGIIEAYVSIFNNVDLVGDKIIKGAFAESLAKKLPKGVWMHNWDEPIAKTLEAREDDKGLYIKGQLILDVQRAKEAYALMKDGVIDEFSIGYRVLEDEWEEDGTRVLKKIRLYEWSPVLAGANPDTELIGVKQEPEKQPLKVVDFIKMGKDEVKIFYRKDGVKKVAVHKLSGKYKSYIKALAEKAAEGQKVDGQKPQLIRLVKNINKQSSVFLRIVKSK